MQTREKIIAKLLLAESMFAHRESQEQSGREMAVYCSTTSTSSQLTFARLSLCPFCGLNNYVLANCHKRKREQGESQHNKRKPSSETG
jgi:hypothetical protein